MRIAHFCGCRGYTRAIVGRSELRLEFAVTCLINDYERCAACAGAECVGIGKTATGAEHLKEFFGLRLDLAEESRFLKDDCPGEQGQDK